MHLVDLRQLLLLTPDTQGKDPWHGSPNRQRRKETNQGKRPGHRQRPKETNQAKEPNRQGQRSLIREIECNGQTTKYQLCHLCQHCPAPSLR